MRTKPGEGRGNSHGSYPEVLWLSQHTSLPHLSTSSPSSPICRFAIRRWNQRVTANPNPNVLQLHFAVSLGKSLRLKYWDRREPVAVWLQEGRRLYGLLGTLRDLALKSDRLRSKRTREARECLVSFSLRDQCAPLWPKTELQPRGGAPEWFFLVKPHHDYLWLFCCPGQRLKGRIFRRASEENINSAPSITNLPFWKLATL